MEHPSPSRKEYNRLRSELVLANSMIECIELILDDKEVSDFMLSFPIVREVYELKLTEKIYMEDK